MANNAHVAIVPSFIHKAEWVWHIMSAG